MKKQRIYNQNSWIFPLSLIFSLCGVRYLSRALMKSYISKYIILFLMLFAFVPNYTQEVSEGEISNSNITKPWTRWWWMGNAVDMEGIKQNLTAFQKAGLGGVEITPIYGVKGEETNYLKFLSPQWVEILDYTIAVADSLGLQVDMTLGTGWPYGGPHVSIENAATRLMVDSLVIKKGQRILERLGPVNAEDSTGAKLNFVVAYGNDRSYLDLTPKIKNNVLKWKAKKSDYTLFKIFTGKTGQRVKRAAPGGEGYTVDHYSNKALTRYLARFDSVFAKNGKGLRAIFNDSYEVYGTDFTPAFFEQFQQRRGYELTPHLRRLLSKSDTEIANRIRSDYRETLSDLLLTQFDEPWTKWANKYGFKSRLQAHGSPGNLIDFYASADIPECETFGSMPYNIAGFRREKEDIREGDADLVMLKFSSSAAHISGKPLVSSETFTWLRDHFKTALSQCKPEAEDLLLSGVNHIFLHGSTYSPERASWPGWKFYASVNFNENNTIWENTPALFNYLQNCQALLQSGNPDNEVLLYWPIHDIWDSYQEGALFFQFKIHSLDEWLHDTTFYKIANDLSKIGYGVDFISDRFVESLSFANGQLVTQGGNYKSLIIPDTDKMPLATFEKLVELKKQGALIFFDGLPESVPGYADYQEKNEVLASFKSKNQEILSLSKPYETLLTDTGILPETIVKSGLKFIRREIDGEKIYFLVNHTAKSINGNFPIQFETDVVTIYDPINGEEGIANTSIQNGRTFVKLDIPSGGSLFLKTGKKSTEELWNYLEEMETVYPIGGEWNLSFVKGGAKLPNPVTLTKLESWTELGEEESFFSGTVQYETVFDNPDDAIKFWKLQLGDVRESAKVWLNEEFIGTVWANPFEIRLNNLKADQNKLRFEVTNLPANRIRAKEIRGEKWKIFHEINMVNKDYEKFDATLWKPTPSGLLGDVTLIPLTTQK